MGIIYKITSPSSRIYVGQTYDLRKRINAHKCAVKMGKNILLHNSVRKYGWDAHILEVIEEVDDILLDEREMFWVKEFQSYCVLGKRGLNMTEGGKGHRSSWMHKTELRKWFSERFSGEGNPFYGKTHSEEAKAEISRRIKERNISSGIVVPEWGAEKGREAVRRPVICCDFYGSYIREYISVTDAAKSLDLNPSSISAVCKGNRNHTGGYVFSYKKVL